MKTALWIVVITVAFVEFSFARRPSAPVISEGARSGQPDLMARPGASKESGRSTQRPRSAMQMSSGYQGLSLSVSPDTLAKALPTLSISQIHALIGRQRELAERYGIIVTETLTYLARVSASSQGKNSISAARGDGVNTAASFVGLTLRQDLSPGRIVGKWDAAFAAQLSLIPDVIGKYKGEDQNNHLRVMEESVRQANLNPKLSGPAAFQAALVSLFGRARSEEIAELLRKCNR